MSSDQAVLGGRRLPLLALPAAVGILAAGAMLAVYLTVVVLAQGWEQAVQLLQQDAYLVAPLAAAFGVQVAMHAYLRVISRMRPRSGRALTGTSGATSTASMVACCAHRVADLLPFLGLTAAAGFLTAYKVPFMIVSLAVSAAGIFVLSRRILRGREVS